MKMTKKDLERRNNYLLLQLKIINELLKLKGKSRDEIFECIGAADYLSSAKTIKNNISFIEEYDETYNFYNKTMNIDDYKN